MREIMAGKWGFPLFGPARAHLSCIKRAQIAGDHSAGNTAALACRVPEQPTVRTLSLTRRQTGEGDMRVIIEQSDGSFSVRIPAELAAGFFVPRLSG